MTIGNATIQATTLTKKKSGWAGKLLRIALVTVFVLAVGLFTAHVVWKSSGSGKWQLVIDKGGVQVYTMKLPGSTLKHFRAVGRAKTSLQRVVAVFTDSSLQHCHDIMSGCLTSSAIEPWNADGHYSVVAIRTALPRPFLPRELVMKEHFWQDPQSKTLFIEITAVPELVAPDNCCVRVTHMDNKWRWTPLENGEIEAEVIEDMDVRVPYILWNARAQEVWGIISRVQVLLDRRKGPDQRFDFVQEPGIERSLLGAPN